MDPTESNPNSIRERGRPHLLVIAISAPSFVCERSGTPVMSQNGGRDGECVGGGRSWRGGDGVNGLPPRAPLPPPSVAAPHGSLKAALTCRQAASTETGGGNGNGMTCVMNKENSYTKTLQIEQPVSTVYAKFTLCLGWGTRIWYLRPWMLHWSLQEVAKFATIIYIRNTLSRTSITNDLTSLKTPQKQTFPTEKCDVD